ncbi:hypothetical protein C8R41DRAFT_846813 [Lentinula lateritia]|uniref:Uncharacterized protein n=1 Tax=Lentinula lateritia TaxID=40482 RepID=A0ABQ8V6E3_9AGAR|nr:hypothetical protein C8R41DRAFT_846813 [Lentinula lateritia]
MGVTALKTFSIKNDIIELSPHDHIHKFDPEADKKMKSLWSKESRSQRGWISDERLPEPSLF